MATTENPTFVEIRRRATLQDKLTVIRKLRHMVRLYSLADVTAMITIADTLSKQELEQAAEILNKLEQLLTPNEVA